jgi:Holliday junction resolvase-like predicted endonuclease
MGPALVEGSSLAALLPSEDPEMTSHQVAVAGEAHAASLFARAGFDVLIQYGPNQPNYDLIASRAGIAVPISVKASRKAGWGLIQSYKKGRTYTDAADAWLADQRPDTVFCLICFKGKQLDEAPLAFLATPREIAEQHKTGKNGHGTTCLYLDYTPSRGVGKGCRHQIPKEWAFTQERA